VASHTSVEQLDAANLGCDILRKNLVGVGLDLDLAVVRHVGQLLAGKWKNEVKWWGGCRDIEV
jgi:hypothetical protein